jgi:hypothetical protein
MILGVFADRAAADGVVRRLRDVGVATSAVRVDEPGGRVASLKAEMREEADNTIVGPGNVGPFTKEMSKGVALWVVVGALVGAAVALPFGLISFGHLGLVTRLVIFGAVGLFTGSTIGFVAGGGLSAGGGYDPLAAEQGVTVTVDAPDSLASEVVRVMRSADPLRLDLGSLDAGAAPVDTFTTREDGDGDGDGMSPALDAVRKVRAGGDLTRRGGRSSPPSPPSSPLR